ncbi:MAG: hypothetical protein Q9226_008307, partial [Calogaya cf. arnoldii]
MDNLDKLFWPAKADGFDPSLYVHNMTNGLYKWRVNAEPFEYDIIDAGGSRPGRKKWHHCMTDSNFVIFVADLNAYCQTIEEEPEVVSHPRELCLSFTLQSLPSHMQNQLEESLSVFESITNLHYLQNATIFVLLNKADLFAKTIHHYPISDFCPDYTGGVDYAKACGYMTDCYRRRNERPPGKLHLLL